MENKPEIKDKPKEPKPVPQQPYPTVLKGCFVGDSMPEDLKETPTGTKK